MVVGLVGAFCHHTDLSLSPHRPGLLAIVLYLMHGLLYRKGGIIVLLLHLIHVEEVRVGITLCVLE